MKCVLCKKMLRKANKYELCSSCQTSALSSLMKRGLIKIEMLRNKK